MNTKQINSSLLMFLCFITTLLSSTPCSCSLLLYNYISHITMHIAIVYFILSFSQLWDAFTITSLSSFTNLGLSIGLLLFLILEGYDSLIASDA